MDVDSANTLELYPDQLESEFIHGYGIFLQKITNTYEWNQIDIINLVDNVIYEYRDDSDNLCNPTLSLNILERSFAYTVVDSILAEETLYRGSREDYANKLKKVKVKTISNKDKIIRFPKK